MGVLSKQCCLVLGLSLSFGALAQGDVLNRRLPSVDFEKTPGRAAVAELFRRVDTDYVIEPEARFRLRGRFTLHKKDITFELALQNVLAEYNLTYRYSGGKFQIMYRGEPPEPRTFQGLPDEDCPEFEADNEDIQSVLRRFFQQYDAEFEVSSAVNGRVCLAFRKTPYLSILRKTLDLVDANVVIRGTKFYVIPAEEVDPEIPALRKLVPSFDFQKAWLDESLKALCQSAGVKCNFPNDLRDLCDERLPAGSFGQELTELVRAHDLDYSYDFSNNTLYFRKSPPAAGDILDADRPMNISYKNADFEEVMGTFFMALHANYAIEPGISGTINLEEKWTPYPLILRRALAQVGARYHGTDLFYIEKCDPNSPSEEQIMNRHVPAFDFRKTPIHTALDQIFHAANVSYRVENGMQGIVTRKIEAGTLRETLDALVSAASTSVDSQLIQWTGVGSIISPALHQPSLQIQYFHGQFEVVQARPTRRPDPTYEKPLPLVQFSHTNFRAACKLFFRNLNASYSISPELDGEVTVHLQEVTPAHALTVMTRLLGGTWAYEAGVFVIFRPEFAKK